MVYTEAGLPIYSKCYSTFCKTAFKNPELLAGFLSALQSLPLTISSDLSLDSVKMGPTEMRFSRTTDACELGDQCPLHTNALQNISRRSKVWSMVKDKYAAMRAKMSAE